MGDFVEINILTYAVLCPVTVQRDKGFRILETKRPSQSPARKITDDDPQAWRSTLPRAESAPRKLQLLWASFL